MVGGIKSYHLSQKLHIHTEDASYDLSVHLLMLEDPTIWAQVEEYDFDDITLHHIDN